MPTIKFYRRVYQWTDLLEDSCVETKADLFAALWKMVGKVKANWSILAENIWQSLMVMEISL